MSNTVKLKCAICDKEFQKPKNEYNRRLRLGKTRFMCSRSCSLVESNRVSPRKGNICNLRPNNRKDQYSQFRWFMRRIRARTKKNNESLSDISEKYLKELWEQQQGICPLSGYIMILPVDTDGFPENRHPYNASLDRINSSTGYIQGNVRFTSLIANLSKAYWQDKDVIEFCKAVSNQQKDD